MLAPRPARRGFTLVELLITLVIVSVVMALVSMTLIAQQRAFYANDRLRDAQSQGRTALTYLERDLMLAGYGIEPALALDFYVTGKSGSRCASVGAVPASPAASANWPTALANTVCNRDNVNRPDELVVHYRDPSYWGQDTSAAPIGHAWGTTGGSTNIDRTAGANRIKLNLRPTDVIAAGRVLQFVCSGGQNSAYLTVKTAATNTGAGVAATWVAFEAAEAGNPFRQEFPANACFEVSSTRAFVVQTRHYYVEADLASGVPYLFLDEAYDRDGSGAVDASDRVVIAEGIEDLQVAYDVRSATTETRLGRTAGALIAFCGISAIAAGTCAGGLRLINFSTAGAANLSTWTYLPFSSQSPERLSPDAANVRTIMVGLVARSLVRVPDKAGTAAPALFNRNANLPAAGGFDRTVLVGSAQPVNLLNRGLPFL